MPIRWSWLPPIARTDATSWSLANQLTQPAQLGGAVHQVATQQHHIRIAPCHGIQYLPAQRFGATVSEVDVADIQQPTRVVPRREPLLADVQGATQSDFQPPIKPRRVNSDL